MVAWSDGVLAALAYASTLVATLRAGSRALYLIEHEHIDVMEGPLILGPGMKSNETLETSPLWDLAQLFQQGVRLALDPGSMEYRVLSVEKPHDEELVQEPYSLSPWPTKKTAVDEGFVSVLPNATSVEDAFTESTAEEIVSAKSYEKLGTSASFLSRVSPRNVLRRAPLIGRLMGHPDETAADDALAFDDNDLDEWDFAYCVSTDVPYNATGSTIRSAEITAYAPGTFADLRSRFGIPEQIFRQSILQSGPYVSFQSNSKGAARVGGVFFFTRDGSYMIKTIKKEEARTLLKMLPKYHKYMKRNGGRSLLTRFCGMYGVSLGTSGTVKRSLHKDDEYIFVVMNSVFPAAGSQFISERFDLKGSTAGRECSQEEKETKGQNAILKDLDLAREVKLVRSLARLPSRTPEYGFHLGPSTKAALLSQLRRDVRLLAYCGVMDYSLLVGVVNMDPHHLDKESMRALELGELQESRIELARRSRGKKNLERAILSSIVTPIRIMSAPPLFFGRRVWAEVDSILSSILTRPLPYYGAGICGVNGGVFSILDGRRSGNRAIYFMGLIDFLQPWTTRKVIERRLKGILGYDTRTISCVPPEEYAARFLDFIEAHVS